MYQVESNKIYKRSFFTNRCYIDSTIIFEAIQKILGNNNVLINYNLSNIDCKFLGQVKNFNNNYSLYQYSCNLERSLIIDKGEVYSVVIDRNSYEDYFKGIELEEDYKHHLQLRGNFEKENKEMLNNNNISKNLNFYNLDRILSINNYYSNSNLEEFMSRLDKEYKNQIDSEDMIITISSNIVEEITNECLRGTLKRTLTK